MKVIHKYPVEPGGKIEIPTNWKFLHFGVNQDGWGMNVLFVWVEKDIDEPEEASKRTYTIVGTGWEYEDKFKHVMTTIKNGLVWHLLEDRG